MLPHFFGSRAEREDPSEVRDRTHLIALHEARIASDYRESLAAEAARPVVARQATSRVAFAGGSTSLSADFGLCCA